MEKTITLTDEEVLAVLIALDEELSSFKESRAVWEAPHENAERLAWYDERIKQMEGIMQKLYRAWRTFL